MASFPADADTVWEVAVTEPIDHTALVRQAAWAADQTGVVDTASTVVRYSVSFVADTDVARWITVAELIYLTALGRLATRAAHQTYTRHARSQQ